MCSSYIARIVIANPFWNIHFICVTKWMILILSTCNYGCCCWASRRIHLHCWFDCNSKFIRNLRMYLCEYLRGSEHIAFVCLASIERYVQNVLITCAFMHTRTMPASELCYLISWNMCSNIKLLMTFAQDNQISHIFLSAIFLWNEWWGLELSIEIKTITTDVSRKTPEVRGFQLWITHNVFLHIAW